MMIKKQTLLIISWAFVLCWMVFIFYLSSQVAEDSNKNSEKITEVIIESIEKVTPEKTFDKDMFNHMIRKYAHFFAYLILGSIVINAIRKGNIKGYKSIIYTFIICILYAVSDEFHQIFVIGRHGNAIDVLIDSSGAIIGVLLFIGISKIMGRYLQKHSV